MRALGEHLIEIQAHLDAAVRQSPPTDDQICLDHVKAALEITKTLRREVKTQQWPFDFETPFHSEG